MVRTESRRRALRAAMAATLGVAMMGCGASVVVDESDGAGGGGGDATIAADEGTASSTEAAATTGAGGHFEIGPIVIAKKCVLAGQTDADFQAYTACCDAVAWDVKAGCQAWGPPMPPAIDWRPAEVAS